MFKQYIGYLLIFTGLLDAIKYSIQARRVQREQSARLMSRKFINFALINDYTRIFYGFIIGDIPIILSGLVAFVCMTDLWWQIYWYYPYRGRGLYNFRKPNVLKYLINSLIPNKFRKRL